MRIIHPFNGGDSVWIRMVEKHIDISISKIRKIKKGSYLVALNLISDKYGHISEVMCETYSDYKICSEVRSVVIKNSGRVTRPAIEVKPLRQL